MSSPSDHLQEDEEPGEGSPFVLTDYSAPAGNGLVITGLTAPERADPVVQRNLAYASLGVVVIFYGAILTLRAVGIFNHEDMTGMIAAFSVIPTLASVAFAFYFAKS